MQPMRIVCGLAVTSKLLSPFQSGTLAAPKHMTRLIMTPATGERLLRFVGDRVRFSLRTEDGAPLPSGWSVLLRTTLGRAKLLRQEIISAYPHRPALANAAWHDVPMESIGNEWA